MLKKPWKNLQTNLCYHSDPSVKKIPIILIFKNIKLFIGKGLSRNIVVYLELRNLDREFEPISIQVSHLMLGYLKVFLKSLLCLLQWLENEPHKDPKHLFCSTCTANQLLCEHVYNSKAVNTDKIQEWEVVVVLENHKNHFNFKITISSFFYEIANIYRVENFLAYKTSICKFDTLIKQAKFQSEQQKPCL